MDKNVRTMMDLIASEVCGKKIDPAEYALSDEELKALYKLSKFHDLAHLVGKALIKNNLIRESELRQKFEKQVMTALYRYERINYELKRLCGALNEAKIPFIPLKGSVIRQYYPEPWMRTSCDIDILVHDIDLERAVKLLTEQFEYQAESKHSHDIGMYSPSGVHLELHYSLIESNTAGKSDKVLKTVWEQCLSEQTCPCRYAMPEEMFYYYHIAHMAKHFQIGGCGVRPFLDLWVLEHKVAHDKEKLNALLEEGELLIFSETVRKLSEVWFGAGEHNDVTSEVEQYVLSGGVYGTTVNRVAVQQVRKGGKVRYALSRIWLPYDTLKFHYPSLEGKRILLPFYEARRWGKLLFSDGAKRGVRELKLNSSRTKDEQSKMNEMLSRIGLKS